MHIYVVTSALVLSIFFGTYLNVLAKDTSLETQLTELQEYVLRMKDAQSGVSLTNMELRTSVEMGIEWTKNAQEPSGHFNYEYIPYENRYRDDDNIVRQAGTLFVLGEMLKRDGGDPYKVGGTMQKAIGYFATLSKKGTYNGKTFRCVTKSKTSTRCDLGASSLALIGILDLVEASPERLPQYQSLITDYHTFILAMQKENGGFRNRFMTNTRAQDDTESPFSNGEALLALTRAYQFKANIETKEAITKAVTYLKAQPYDNNLYLWIMAVLKDIEKVDPALASVTYVHDFTLWRIERGKGTHVSNRNFCAYTEGVVSALSVLKGKTPDATYTKILQEAEYGLRKNRTLQLTEQDETRAFVQTGVLTTPSLANIERALGGFMTAEDEPTQRIDYTQHCVSAYLQMLMDVRGLPLSE